MELKNKKVGDIIIIYLSGRLDVYLSAEIEKEINRVIKNQLDHHILLHLRDVEYMSSSGLRIFVSTMRILKESKRILKLCNMNDPVRKIFEVVELLEMFDIYDSEEQAIASFNND